MSDREPDKQQKSLPGLQALQQATQAAKVDILRGIQAGLAGRRTVPMPEGWAEAYPELAKSGNAEVREKVWSLLMHEAEQAERELQEVR